MEHEGHLSNTDKVYQPATANVMGLPPLLEITFIYNLSAQIKVVKNVI